jgi:hypothetical protein
VGFSPAFEGGFGDILFEEQIMKELLNGEHLEFATFLLSIR